MIYYIGHYSCEKIRHEDRAVSAVGVSKMNYIISALSETGVDDIEIVSPAVTKKDKIVKGAKYDICDRVTLKTFTSIGGRNKLIRIFGQIFTRCSFLLYLLFKVSAKDQIIVYHSLSYMTTISIVRKLKKCSFILEIEEIYADIKENEFLRKKETNYFKRADKYILITKLLLKEINSKKKNIVSHGTYLALPKLCSPFDDNRKHIVYAGTFSRVKAGVFQAIAAAEYLDSSYVLHILGGGTETEIENVTRKIQETAAKTACEIRYVGYKQGDDFNAYIQSCNIGLSTQQPEGKYNATSFPSKILMYMSHGLRVVSIRIPAVETSEIGEFIYYYDTPDGKTLAEAIRSVPFDDKYDSRAKLQELHSLFVEKLSNLLQE